MSGIAAFLAARLDEDDLAAQHNLVSDGPALDAERVIREVAAKRAILAAHGVERTGKYGSPGPARCLTCISERYGYQEDWNGDLSPCLTLRLLATVYSDHPDYDPEWSA